MSENLVGRWTFAGLGGPWDETENWDAVTLMGNAALTHQGLVVSRTGWARVTGYRGPTVAEKTLISWLFFNDLSFPESAGSALTLDATTTDQFDGIVFGERLANAWTAGSSHYQRTPMPTAANPTDFVTGVLIKVAVTYRDAGNGLAEINLYHNDQLFLSYTQGPLASWDTSNAEVVFGMRHTGGNSGPGYLEATIVAAELHNACLTAEELKTRTIDDPCTFIRPGISLQSVSFPDRYVHVLGMGPAIHIDPITTTSDPMEKARATLYIVPGLADPRQVSLVMAKPPGQYLAIRNGEIGVFQDDGSSGFRSAATFYMTEGLAGEGVSFQSYDQPGLYLRQQSYQIVVQPSDGSDTFRRDASFRQQAPFMEGLTTEIPLDEQHWYLISNHSSLPGQVLVVDDSGVVSSKPLTEVPSISRGLWRFERLSDAGVHRWRLINNYFDNSILTPYGPTLYLDGTTNPLSVVPINPDPGQSWTIRPIPWMGSDYFSITNDSLEPHGQTLAMIGGSITSVPYNLDFVEERWRFTCMGAVTNNTYQVLTPPARINAIDGTPRVAYVARYPRYTGVFGIDILTTGTVSEWALHTARTVITNILLTLRNRTNIAGFAGYRIIIVGDNDLDIAAYPDFKWKEANDWRGGSGEHVTQVTEEMMCRHGVTNRPGDLLYYRRFDQFVHEFGHAIDRFVVHIGGEDFPWWCQWWFNSNGEAGGTRETFRNTQPANYEFMRANVFLANREWYTPPDFRSPNP